MFAGGGENFVVCLLVEVESFVVCLLVMVEVENIVVCLFAGAGGKLE